MVLEADEVVGVGSEVFLTELDAGIRPSPCFWISQPYGFHGSEAEGVATSAGGLFDGEAAFEVMQL